MPKDKSRLTDKQERFVLEVVKGKSQYEAFKIAYNAENMQDSTIREKASRLMAQCNISARYEELRSKASARLEEKAIVTVEGLLADLQMIKNQCLIKKKVYKETEEGVEEIETDSFIDANAAIKAVELMGKHIKMFTDKVEHSGKIEMPQITITK